MSNVLKKIKYSEIHVPERLRCIDRNQVVALMASIESVGLLNPITVRATPAAKGGKYTLVAGAHRLSAIGLLEWAEVDVMIVKADEADARLIEIQENLFRNELSQMERAVFVQAMRDTWEEKYGEIKRGNPQFSNSANIAELLGEEIKEGRFDAYCADRLGLSERTIRNTTRIAQSIPAHVREALSGTPIADNQSQLLALTRLEPAELKMVPKALELADGDFSTALNAVQGKKPPEPQSDLRFLNTLIGTWERCSGQVRADFLAHIEKANKPVAQEAA